MKSLKKKNNEDIFSLLGYNFGGGGEGVLRMEIRQNCTKNLLVVLASKSLILPVAFQC